MNRIQTISIITPSYNQSQYIEKTIKSVIENINVKLEYIVIDGGSKDETINIIEKYKNQLTYWTSEPDHGHSDAVNKGLKYCSGEIINWLNSDDFYEPGALKIIADTFESNPETLVVTGSEITFESDSGRTIELNSGTNITGDIHKLIYNGIIDQPCTFFKKKVIDSLGPLPLQLHYTMDSWWWTKFLLQYGADNVVKIPDLITHFRLHSGSKTVSKQHLFDNDRYAIKYKLAQYLKLSPLILDYFELKTNIHDLPSIHEGGLHETVSKKRLSSYFYEECFVEWYRLFELKPARKAFVLFVKSASIPRILKHWKYFFRFLIPDILLKVIRNRNFK